MIHEDWISAIEILWVGAVFCIFSRQVGIWRREERRQKNMEKKVFNREKMDGDRS